MQHCKKCNTHPCRLPSCSCDRPSRRVRPCRPAACLQAMTNVQQCGSRSDCNKNYVVLCSGYRTCAVLPPQAAPAAASCWTCLRRHLPPPSLWGGLPLQSSSSAPAEPMARGLRPAAAASMREVCTPEGGVLGCRPQLHFITLPPSACGEGGTAEAAGL